MVCAYSHLHRTRTLFDWIANFCRKTLIKKKTRKEKEPRSQHQSIRCEYIDSLQWAPNGQKFLTICSVNRLCCYNIFGKCCQNLKQLLTRGSFLLFVFLLPDRHVDGLLIGAPHSRSKTMRLRSNGAVFVLVCQAFVVFISFASSGLTSAHEAGKNFV